METFNELKVESRLIQTFYDEYLDGQYRVNRRYQRKLVWNLSQKETLIDSILTGLPIPLFLLAKLDLPGESRRQYEIVDGLQRLDAIVSYINNDFAWKGKYFNVEAMASTKARADDPGDDLRQKGSDPESILDRNLARKIANYELPFSIFETESYEDIDEVFRRINSSGRLLSAQEVRQAGVLHPFAELVRDLAAEVRGDATMKSVLPLQDAPWISLDFDGSGRGIDGSGVFWYRNGILKTDNLRSSLDEQLIVDILLDMLNTQLTLSSDTRDKAYKADSAVSADIVKKLKNSGTITSRKGIEKRFHNVMSLLGDLETYLTSFANQTKRSMAVMKHMGLDLNNSYPRYFLALFLAIDEQLVQQKRLKSADSLASDIAGYYRNHKTPGGGSGWDWKNRREFVENLRKHIAESFVAGPGDGAVSEQNKLSFLESRLYQYPHESDRFELKQGLTDLKSPEAKQISKKIRDLAKIATAMRNSDPSDSGMIIVGVVDGDPTMKTLKKERSVEGIAVQKNRAIQGIHIVGIEHDLDALDITLDKYIDMMIEGIRSAPELNDDAFIDGLVSGIEVLPVMDAETAEIRHVVSIDVPESSTPVTFGGQLFYRSGSSTEMADYDRMKRIDSAFTAHRHSE